MLKKYQYIYNQFKRCINNIVLLHSFIKFNIRNINREVNQ